MNIVYYLNTYAVY